MAAGMRKMEAVRSAGAIRCSNGLAVSFGLTTVRQSVPSARRQVHEN
jgi:hypothetical protein